MTIKELRELTGLSQSQFAEEYKFTIRQVQAWEQGYRKTPECIMYLLEKVIRAELNLKEDNDNV